jgi:ankyrin repeat protein
MKHILITTIAVTSLLATTAFADPIHDAAKNGDLAGVQAELDKGTDVNAKDEWGWTPLHSAAGIGHKETVELLISEGADVNAMTNTGWTPLHLAGSGGQKEIAELLIANGANVNAKRGGGKTPLDLAGEVYDWHSPEVKAARKEVADLIRQHGGKYSKIHFAARDGDIEAVKEFLAAGADVKDRISNGMWFTELTPLQFATDEGHKEIVELLIAKGADVNAKYVNGETPLHMAASNGDKEIAELLIANGADVNAKDRSGETPLDSLHGYRTEIAALLRKHDAKTGEELKAQGK